MKIVLMSVSVLLLLNVAYGQSLKGPRIIKAQGEYVQEASNTIFPAAIGTYARTELSAFDKQNRDIVSEYESVTDAGKTKISVYVFPANDGDENRLRNQFLFSLKAIAIVANKDLQPTNSYCYYKEDSYKVNGYRALFNDGNANLLEVYECGGWFLKIRISSNVLSAAEIEKLEKQVADSFSPAGLVEESPLDLKGDMTMSPELRETQDQLMIAATQGIALKKISWAAAHVDSMERIGGFPGLYLDMHMAAYEASLKAADSSIKRRTTKATTTYLEQLRLLIANNYLDEFLMEQYQMVMIVPDGKTFNFEEYTEWKQTHPITIRLNTDYTVQYKLKKPYH